VQILADADRQQLWIRQWRRASVTLAEQRERDLREMSAQQALAAIDALLSLAPLVPLHPSRLTDSGLVRQQALFHRRAVT
jgi:hypothetical protein